MAVAAQKGKCVPFVEAQTGEQSVEGASWNHSRMGGVGDGESRCTRLSTIPGRTKGKATFVIGTGRERIECLHVTHVGTPVELRESIGDGAVESRETRSSRR